MPTITPALVPAIPPGSLFQALTTRPSLNVRWLSPLDPVMYEVLNRPHADITLRQLILAKAIDQLNTSLGHQAMFPFLVQPTTVSGSGTVDVPTSLLWDLNISVPAKWQKLRLAKIKRISGVNQSGIGTDGSGNQLYAFNGRLRLIFTGQQVGGVETALLMADYVIDSSQTYQPVLLSPVPSTEEAEVASAADQATVSGYAIFKTLDYNDLINQTFILAMAPPVSATNTAGYYLSPAVYQLSDAIPGSTSGWFDANIVVHGTGYLGVSAWNALPTLAADVQSWINAFNYPFDAIATRTATNSMTIPLGMFREFNIAAPAGDQPSDDTTGTFFPVWVNRIARIDQTGSHLRFYFATYNVTDTAPAPTPIEFATLDLLSTMIPDTIVDIVPADNLKLQDGSGWGQHFGRGHVVLSDQWGPAANAEIQTFFTAFGHLTESVAEIEFAQTASRLSSFGLSRVPKYIPTIGQSQALVGSTSRLAAAIEPSSSNLYVTEQDQGLGVAVDLEQQPGITPDTAVDRIAYTGALCHRLVRMVVDPTKMPDGIDDDVYYDTVILPRLTILLGRPPQFGDCWFNGTRFMWYMGSAWVG